MTKNEILAVGGILSGIIALSLLNFRQSEILARDVQRTNDLKHISTALGDYLKNNTGYPPSQDNKIVACGQGNSLCEWGKDSIIDPKDPSQKYIDPLPEDPLAPPKEFAYLYFSNTKHFQLLAHLERTDNPEYNGSIAKRGLMCGTGVCNFGIADGKTPLGEDLESSGTGSGSATLK